MKCCSSISSHSLGLIVALHLLGVANVHACSMFLLSNSETLCSTEAVRQAYADTFLVIDSHLVLLQCLQASTMQVGLALWMKALTRRRGPDELNEAGMDPFS